MQKHLLYTIILSALLGSVACTEPTKETPPPPEELQEIIDARAAIERAKSVEAEEFATDSLEQAEAKLAEAETSFDAGNIEDARASALSSIDFANQAYEQAVRNRAEYYFYRSSELTEQAQEFGLESDQPETWTDVTNRLAQVSNALVAEDFSGTYNTAKPLVDDLLHLLDQYKNIQAEAQNMINKAQDAYDAAVNKRNLNRATLQQAKDKIFSARDAYNQQDYEKALQDAEQALRLIQNAQAYGVNHTTYSLEDLLALARQKRKEASLHEPPSRTNRRQVIDLADIDEAIAQAEQAYEQQNSNQTANHATRAISYANFILYGGSLYTVKRGDNLWDISDSLYGTPWYWKTIWYGNDPVIGDPDLIYPRQAFHVPKKSIARENFREEQRRLRNELAPEQAQAPQATQEEYPRLEKTPTENTTTNEVMIITNASSPVVEPQTNAQATSTNASNPVVEPQTNAQATSTNASNPVVEPETASTNTSPAEESSSILESNDQTGSTEETIENPSETPAQETPEDTTTETNTENTTTGAMETPSQASPEENTIPSESATTTPPPAEPTTNTNASAPLVAPL